MFNKLKRFIILCLLLLSFRESIASEAVTSSFRNLLPNTNNLIEIDSCNVLMGDLLSLKTDAEAEFYKQFKPKSGNYINDTEYIAQIQDISSLIKREFPQYDQIPIALYIASGTDSVIAHKIFSSKISIGVDDHPFWTPGMNTLKVFAISGTDFRYSHDIDKQNTPLAPNLVGSFFRHIPNFRVQRVILFNTQEALYNTESGSGTAFHGLIIFDTGPGTELRAHLQIQTVLRIDTDITTLWWFKNVVKEFGPNIALIEKASHGTYNGSNMNDRTVLKDSLEKFIRTNHGIWIEGSNSTYGGTWGFAPFEKYSKAKEKKVKRWGYDNRIRIVPF